MKNEANTIERSIFDILVNCQPLQEKCTKHHHFIKNLCRTKFTGTFAAME